MDIFKKKRYYPYIYKSKNKIWRFLFNNNGIISGESRNAEQKTVSFFCINYKDNIRIFDNLTMLEKWWVSIEFISDEVIFITKFKKPDMPDQKGIIAVDIKTGSILWENDEVTFIFNKDNYTYGFRQLFEKKKLYKLNDKGEIIEELDDNFLNSIIESKEDYNEKLFSDCIYPNQYIEGSETDIVVNGILNKTETTQKITGFIEYILYKKLFIYNLHKYSGTDTKNILSNKYDNIIKLFDMNTNKIVMEETLNHNVTAFAPDSFFIKNNYLIYVKDKIELTIHNLNIFEDNY